MPVRRTSAELPLDVDQLDVAAIRLQKRPDPVEHRLDAFPRNHRSSPSVSLGSYETPRQGNAHASSAAGFSEICEFPARDAVKAVRAGFFRTGAANTQGN